MTAYELPRTMQAVICHAPEDYRLEEYPVPEAGAGEVVIRVQSVGICASDLKCYLGAPLFWGDEHREGYCQAPIIPGHEFVGEVVALGDGRGRHTGWRLGIWPCRSRSCRADSAGIACGGSTGCVWCTIFTGFGSGRSGRWPNM